MDKHEHIRNALKKNVESYYINDIYNIIIQNQNNSKNKKVLIFAYLNYYIYMMISGILILINALFKHEVDCKKEIALARVPRTEYKITKVLNDIQIIRDDIKCCDFTIYKIGSRNTRLILLFRDYWRFCNKDLSELEKLLDDEHLREFKTIVLEKLARRIPHTVMYKYAIETIMKEYMLTTIYTGQMYDRFALIEGKLAKSYGKKLICLPHGIESLEERPATYVGDLFYCSSEEMGYKLNVLYKSDKFVFDEEVSRKMYSIYNTKEIDTKAKKDIVFFTQPIYTKETKEIIAFVSKYLEYEGQTLYIKVHPSESKEEYRIENTQFIECFDEAIIKGVCISYASTILIEALYNQSDAISIVHLIKKEDTIDGDNYFLNDNRILKPKDKNNLLEILDIKLKRR